jgi:hypothetical protein
MPAEVNLVDPERLHRGPRKPQFIGVCEAELLQTLRGVYGERKLKKILRPDRVGTQDDKRIRSG